MDVGRQLSSCAVFIHSETCQLISVGWPAALDGIISGGHGLHWVSPSVVGYKERREEKEFLSGLMSWQITHSLNQSVNQRLPSKTDWEIIFNTFWIGRRRINLNISMKEKVMKYHPRRKWIKLLRWTVSTFEDASPTPINKSEVTEHVCLQMFSPLTLLSLALFLVEILYYTRKTSPSQRPHPAPGNTRPCDIANIRAFIYSCTCAFVVTEVFSLVLASRL